MGVDSDQPLAEGKGVHREVESEGSLRQSSGLRNTNHIRRFRMDKAAIQAEVQKLSGILSVNVADEWNESNESYPGRSCQRGNP